MQVDIIVLATESWLANATQDSIACKAVLLHPLPVNEVIDMILLLEIFAR